MKDVALVGLPQSGKSTVFTAVSRHVAQFGKENQAVVDVPDERIDTLAEIYKSQKRTKAQIRLVDVAGLDTHSLGAARAADALAIVLRAFGDGADPTGDLDSFRAELAVADLSTVEKVSERAGKKRVPEEADVAAKAEKVLSDGHWLSEADWSDDEWRILQLWTPLTLKPSLNVVNAEDPSFDASAIPGPRVVICGALEAEATELEPAEAAELLHGFGLSEPAAPRFIKAAYDALGLLTFFTAGPTESRAWAVARGSRAPQAAGAIHTDFERAFIRAEKVSFADITACGSEQAARDKGLLRAEGKDYEVKEGDVLLILHSA
jgi:hypothetical protein